MPLDYQKTIKTCIPACGVGLHTGKKINIKLKPALPDTGVVFVRSDLSTKPEIKASSSNVVLSRLCTRLENSTGISVSTVEHLMAALYGNGVNNLIVEIDGPEIPVMDGSAAEFEFLINSAGIEIQKFERKVLKVLNKIEIKDNDRYISILPNEGFSIDYKMFYDNPVIGRQNFKIDLVDGSFTKLLSKARTFCLKSDVANMRRNGLALGGSLENAIVVDGDKILNEGGLRYPDEFVRHKILDIVGDFALLGMSINCKVVACRSGHDLNHRLLTKMLADKDSYIIEPRTIDETWVESCVAVSA